MMRSATARVACFSARLHRDAATPRLLAPRGSAPGLRAIVCGLVCLLSAASVLAVEPIDTDGPDFVESSEVVPVGRLQYELDLSAVQDRRDRHAGTRLATPGLFKIGIAPDWEWRFAPSGMQHEAGQSGWGNLALGLKWHVLDRDASVGRPAVAWIAHLDALAGSTRFGDVRSRPSLRSVITWDLPHELALGVMPGIQYGATADAPEHVAGILGVVLNHRFGARLRAFVEYSASQVARATAGGTVASYDVGAAWLVTDETQIGVRYGIAANNSTPDHFMLFEVAQRF